MTPSRRRRLTRLDIGVGLTLLGACLADSRAFWLPLTLIGAGLILVVMSLWPKPRCKVCNAAIAWVRTTNGTVMPVDARPWLVVREAPVVPREHRAAVVTDDGRVVWGVRIGQADSRDDAAVIARLTGGTVGRRPHWASCPEAERFRCRKGSAGDAAGA